MMHVLIFSANSPPSSISLRRAEAEAVGVGPLFFFLLPPDGFGSTVPLVVLLEEEGIIFLLGGLDDWPATVTLFPPEAALADADAAD